MPFIDVFIALKMYKIETDPNTHKDIKKRERSEGEEDGFPVPNWYDLKRSVSRFGTYINIYEEELGNCNKWTFLESLRRPGRVVVFIGHGWTDSRNRNGRDEPGFGIRINEGQYLGTFGITQSMTNPNTGMNYGEYTTIPLIKASRVFFFTCNPGSDFPDILKRHLKLGSAAYYINAGRDNLVWAPALEKAAFTLVKGLIFNQDYNQEIQAVRNAQSVLDQKLPWSDGDQIRRVWGTK